MLGDLDENSCQAVGSTPPHLSASLPRGSTFFFEKANLTFNFNLKASKFKMEPREF